MKPNVVFITIDSLRYDKANKLDIGMKSFEHMYVDSPSTGMSFTSIMTGVSSYDFKIPSLNNYVFDDKYKTLFTILKENGYQTKGFMDVGYAFNWFKGFWKNLDNIEHTSNKEKVKTWVEKEAKEPFFLWVHIFDLHAERRNRDYSHETYNRILEDVNKKVKYILDILPGNSIIVVMSDHGEELNEYGVTHHGWWLHENSIKIPCYMYFPDTKIDTTKLARTIDIVPTILSFLGIPEHMCNGVDLFNNTPEYCLLSTRFMGENKRKAGIVTKDWKYVKDIDKHSDSLFINGKDVLKELRIIIEDNKLYFGDTNGEN